MAVVLCGYHSLVIAANGNHTTSLPGSLRAFQCSERELITASQDLDNSALLMHSNGTFQLNFKLPKHKKRRAGTLLAIDENQSPMSHKQVTKAFRVKKVTICRLCQRLIEEGLEVAVNSKHAGNILSVIRPGYKPNDYTK